MNWPFGMEEEWQRYQRQLAEVASVSQRLQVMNVFLEARSSIGFAQSGELGHMLREDGTYYVWGRNDLRQEKEEETEGARFSVRFTKCRNCSPLADVSPVHGPVRPRGNVAAGRVRGVRGQGAGPGPHPGGCGGLQADRREDADADRCWLVPREVSVDESIRPLLDSSRFRMLQQVILPLRNSHLYPGIGSRIGSGAAPRSGTRPCCPLRVVAGGRHPMSISGRLLPAKSPRRRRATRGQLEELSG